MSRKTRRTDSGPTQAGEVARPDVVFAALAVSRYLTTTTGQSLKKIIRTLRAVHTATIEVNGQRLTLDQAPNDTANAILTALETGH